MKTKSFTLIELLVVIVIIGILAGVITITTTSYISKANLAKNVVFAESVRNNLFIGMVSEWSFDDCYESGGKYYTTDSQDENDGWLGLTACTPGVDSCPTFYGSDSNRCVDGGCFYFDGVDDVIQFNPGKYPDPGTITITGWINISSFTGEDHFFGKAWSDGTGLEIVNGNVRFAIYDTSGTRSVYTSNQQLSLNSWHFIGGSYNHQTKEISIFFDGIFYDPNPQNTYSVRSNVVYVLQAGRADRGSPTVSRAFNGYIDKIAYYTEVLSSQKIKEMYFSGLNSLLANGNISKEEYDERLNTLAMSNY